MKRQNNVRWKEGSETPQKKRTKSLNIAKKSIDHLNHDTIPNSFSNIKKLLSLDSENIEKESTEKISVSSIPDGEFFSEINFNIKLTVDNVIRNDDQQILDCKTHKVILMDDWKDIIMYKGMTISIFDCPCCNTSTNIVDTEIVVDATNHIMTIDDAIIPVTTYCEAFNCIYKPLLKEKIIDITFQYSHSSMAVGVIIHSVIEMCLKANNFTLKFIVEKLKAIIADNTSLLYACNLSSKNAMIDCTKFIKNIMKLSEQPSFARCCAVEKKIVSHMYSLRGNIDAVLLDNGCQIPLEIKTGKRVDFKHYAQIIMYLLMTREKNTENVSHGLLYYVHEGLLKRINLKHNEVMSLCILRNEIASIRYETKQKVRTDRNFVGYPESFNPVCKCDDIEYCKTIKNLFLLEEFKGDFLREQWLAINEDEECQKQTEFYPSIFIEQKDNNLVVAVDIQEINNIREFLEIYDINKNRICFGRMTRIENNRVYLTLNTSYNLLCYYNLYICNTKNELFYKTMRYSLLNVAITSDVFNIDNSTQDKKEYNCITSSAEKYLEFMTQLETQDTNDKISEIIPLPYRQDFFELNEDQRSALYLALNCKKYHLVHGFPGTGKSHLIRLFIKILCYTKKKVLLICYTNLALDNILDKLPVKYYRALKDKNKFNDTESMRRYFDGIELVAGTCFSFTDVIFLQRKFDLCIVDEASQQHFLLTLIPISLSNKFLLVGDHLQLKPISVKSQCLQISLFEHLIKTQRSELKLQYRMPDNIMNLSNRLFYDNKMKGTGRKGTIEFIDTDGDYKDIINTIVKKTKPTRRDLEKKNVQSENILDRMNMILEASKESANTFINEDDLTILCYFNSTVSQIRANTNNNVNVETIDKFQGSEAKHIVVVFDPIIDCEIMNSKERLNVSLTRAKERLTLIGDSTKMKTIGVLAAMLDLLI